MTASASAPSSPTRANSPSAWAPLALPAFRMLWIAQLGSNIGTWMQTVGAQWYLVEAAAGATLIALVQTASLAPSLLLSLPSGVLADVLDRRRLLIWGSAASAVLAAVLTAVSAFGALTPVFVLAITFLLGVTSTLTSPAWQAIQPELVPRELIGASSALGGAAVNGARAVGPALAGVVLSFFGAPMVFALNAISFVGAVVALVAWRRPPQEGLDDRERFTAALRAGVRYVVSARLVRRILLRSALFAAPAGALWALLPLTAERMGLDSTGYGLLLGALGVGAVLGIVLLPLVRKRLHDSLVLALSATLFGLSTAGAALLPFWPALAVLLVAGLAWIGTLTVLNANLQLTLPQWVRSRGAAVYILVFMGTMSISSLLWGVVAQLIGEQFALLAAAALLMIVAASVRFLPLLPGTGAIDRSAATCWATPALQVEPEPTDGPVLVEVAYRVPPEKLPDLLVAVRLLGGSRRRTGAYRWRVYRSLEEGDVVLESFLVPSWSEYRRQRTQRLTGRDREMERDVRALVDADPTERHYLAAG